MSDFAPLEKKLSKHQYTWLITGVAGFIGSHLLEYLLKNNQKVIGLDNFSTGFQHNIQDALALIPSKTYENFTFIEGDICDQTTCQRVMQNVDFVLHQAALGSVSRSIETPLVTHTNNVSGFLNILLCAKDQRVKNFVYASSSSVYGDHHVLPKQEDCIGNPLSPYAASKRMNELYAQSFYASYKFPSTGLRYFNIFGPRQNPQGPYAAVIPLWIKQLLDHQQIYINGDGETSRDFTYIENVVYANIAAALNDHIHHCQVYNIACGQQLSLNDLFNLLTICLDQDFLPPLYQAFRTGDVRHSLANVEKAQQDLKYNPELFFHQALANTVAWFKNKHLSPHLS